MDYNARFYGHSLGRFTQPDTIIPDPNNPQTLNRYSYVNNNPIKFVDPTGHSAETCEDESKHQTCGGVSVEEMIGVVKSYFSFVGINDYENWTVGELQILLEALLGILKTFGNDMGAFEGAVGGNLTFNRSTRDHPWYTKKAAATYDYWTKEITIYNSMFDQSADVPLFTIAHEVGHDIDDSFDSRPSKHFADRIDPYEGTPVRDEYRDPVEDFAYTFAWRVQETNGWYAYPVEVDKNRQSIVDIWISVIVQVY